MATAKSESYMTSGEVIDWGQLIADIIFGVKVRLVNPEDEKAKRQKEKQFDIRSLQSEIKQINRSKTISPEEKSRRVEKLQERIQNIQ
jgi:thiamine biosynthesis lipoprotein ApbE